MSDTSQGPGWWQATDGRWYPPEDDAAEAADDGADAPATEAPKSSLPPPSTPPPPPPAPAPAAPGGPGPYQAGPYFHAQPPPKAMSTGKVILIVIGVLIVFGVLVVGCLAIVIDDVADEVRDQTGPAADADFELSEPVCDADELGFARFRALLTNTSAETQGFEVSIEVVDEAGTRLGLANQLIDALEPGRDADVRLELIARVEPGVPFSCLSLVSYTPFDSR